MIVCVDIYKELVDILHTLFLNILAKFDFIEITIFTEI